MTKVTLFRPGLNHLDCAYEVDFDSAVNLMDNDIREQVHAENCACVVSCTEQMFMDAYADAHFIKFGEVFVVN